MSPLIIIYVTLIALIVLGVIVASVLYLNCRRGTEPAGQPPTAPPLPKDRRPPSPH